MTFQRVLLSATIAILISDMASGAFTSYGEGSGLIGLGLRLYEPHCAFACLYCIRPRLNCTIKDKDDNPSSRTGWAVTAYPSAKCKQSSEFYMLSVAWCMEARCENESRARLENFWLSNVPRLHVGETNPEPKLGFTETLSASKDTPPTRLFSQDYLLNYTAFVSDDLYLPRYERIRNHAANEAKHEQYAAVIFLSGTMIPVVASVLRFAPWPGHWVNCFNGYFVYPPCFGNKHSTPTIGIGFIPTRGQALFIAYLFLLSILYSTLGFRALGSQYHHGLVLAANRQGVLSFCFLPLVILNAGRNSVLLWMTNWSRSTFLLLHRWTAFLCTLHATLHSLFYLYIAVHRIGKYDYSVNSKHPDWHWGIIGTVVLSAIVPLSTRSLQKWRYEFFRLSHVALTTMALVGCYKHIDLKYSKNRGYQIWIFLAVGLWAFEYVVRFLRLVRGGLKKYAYITSIDEDYYRIDIPGTFSTGHVYLYFPTVTPWRPWESHPFSVAAVNGWTSESFRSETADRAANKTDRTLRVPAESASSTSSGNTLTPGCHTNIYSHGLVFFARKQKGITSRLPGLRNRLPVLVEGPYTSNGTFLQRGHIEPTDKLPNLICIAGGVGISGVLPALHSFSSVARPAGICKVYWAVRSMPLVYAVERMLGHHCGDAIERTWNGTTVALSVGARLDLRETLREELWSKSMLGGATIVVCGPPSMADEVRCAVAGLARCRGEYYKPLNLIVEDFTW